MTFKPDFILDPSLSMESGNEQTKKTAEELVLKILREAGATITVQAADVLRSPPEERTIIVTDGSFDQASQTNLEKAIKDTGVKSVAFKIAAGKKPQDSQITEAQEAVPGSILNAIKKRLKSSGPQSK